MKGNKGKAKGLLKLSSEEMLKKKKQKLTTKLNNKVSKVTI